jgi:hypothetical protein
MDYSDKIGYIDVRVYFQLRGGASKADIEAAVVTLLEDYPLIIDSGETPKFSLEFGDILTGATTFTEDLITTPS